MLKAPQAIARPQPGGYGPTSSARPPWRATPAPESVSGKEATRKACGVLVARLQGHSWAPPLPTGCAVNVGTIRCRPLLRPARPGAGRPIVGCWQRDGTEPS